MSRRRTHPGWLVALLAVLMLVPNGSMAASDVVVVPVRKASAIDLSPHVLWVLALGSDARRGQQVTRSRADALQLVGINTRTGAATAIGVPRGPWGRIPGRGNAKNKSAMVLRGQQREASDGR